MIGPLTGAYAALMLFVTIMLPLAIIVSAVVAFLTRPRKVRRIKRNDRKDVSSCSTALTQRTPRI